jgi:hypothetical protein
MWENLIIGEQPPPDQGEGAAGGDVPHPNEKDNNQLLINN